MGNYSQPQYITKMKGLTKLLLEKIQPKVDGYGRGDGCINQTPEAAPLRRAALLGPLLPWRC
jgi:hypothetical protein